MLLDFSSVHFASTARCFSRPAKTTQYCTSVSVKLIRKSPTRQISFKFCFESSKQNFVRTTPVNHDGSWFCVRGCRTMALFFAGMSSVVGSALLTEPPNKPPKNLLVNAGGSQASRWNSAHTNPPRTIRLITLPSLAGTKRAGTSLYT